MEKQSIQMNLLRATIILLLKFTLPCSGATSTQELYLGFKATPNPSVSLFQSLLTDSTSNFSLGFLRVNRTLLALAVLHVPSSEPLWLAKPNHMAHWSEHTQLFFNGSLVISDPKTKLFWSTATTGNRVVLLNTSNLQVQNSVSDSVSVLWQSFDFPTNSIVENQNFTVNMSLVSSNGLYSMRLGDNFLGLYAKFRENSNQIYWKHKALQAKADIVDGQGPIHAQVHSDGYLGMYQSSNVPVDVQPFNSFQRPINGLLRMRLEPNGDLKGYYWDGSNWVLDYQAISDSCELPSPCGSYGLCTAGPGCSCLDNKTEFHAGGCFAAESGDLCGKEETKIGFWVLRRKGVELPYKELMRYETTSSLAECESTCERNCSCWGAVYNNGSGFCYLLDYPIQTLVAVSDESKVGYFKVRNHVGNNKNVGFEIAVGLLAGGVLVFVGSIGLAVYRKWRRRRNETGFLEEENGVSPGPYKNLGSASFRSIEMSTTR